MDIKFDEHLVIYEIANNHMGDVDHGIELVSQFAEISKEFRQFNFAFKLQYRDLDSFIHKSSRGRSDIKYVKRFEETKLREEQFQKLIQAIRERGFAVVCTPFDEISVDLIIQQNLDVIKIASCSFTDWPLLEKVASSGKPVIASTAGASVLEIDRVVSFFRHRKIELALMHCVAEYPTKDENLDLGQIDLLKRRYPHLSVGYSTHENPANVDAVKLAIAMGARIFEKHVGLTSEKYAVNDYSINPEQAALWLNSAATALSLCGEREERRVAMKEERDSLASLRRGIFAKRDLMPNQSLTQDDVYFAFPPEPSQLVANQWSKYCDFKVRKAVGKDEPLESANVAISDSRSNIWAALQKVKSLLNESGTTIPNGIDLELSHHYGMEKFDQYGLTMLTVINRGYCKKLLISLPGQIHPEQHHNVKAETFHVLFGEVELTLDGLPQRYMAGDIINIEPGVRHSFVSEKGCVIEEISSTHSMSDSVYTDKQIMANTARKTVLTYWMDTSELDD